jgi:hypothetical protein
LTSPDDRDDPERRLERIRAAVRSVKSEVRGLPQDEAEERLVSALRLHDAFLSRSSVRVLARSMRDPWWVHRHPIKAWRQSRRDFDAPDPESDRCAAETARLSRKLEEISGVTTWFSKRTMDGMLHVVTIDPWSDELADQVREVSSPTSVTVVPAQPIG